MKFTLTCAATAPKGCLVKVSAKIAGKSAMRSMTVVLPRGKAIAGHGDALQEHDASA